MTSGHRISPRAPRTARGFTLLELMITVAVVGILAAIAYPAYTESVLKGRRAEARTGLTELLQQQERYMTQRNTYLKFDNTGGTTSPAPARDTFKVFTGNSATSTAYWLSAETCDAPNQDIRECVKVVASPVRADPAADKLWITSTGEKSCTGNKKTVCWR